MTFKRSYLVAGLLVLGIAIWFAVNSAGEDVDVYEAGAKETAQTALPTVVVRDVMATPHPLRLSAYGRTAPNREVTVRASTAASVVSAPVTEGSVVRAGQTLCRQDVDARQAVVDQAKAAVLKAETDLAATRTLVDRGFQSNTSIPRDQAALDAARAQMRQAENELGNVIMRAPFAGVLDERMAELGDYLAPGQACGTVVELDPLKVEAEVTETQVGDIALGQTVQVALATGTTVEGTVSFIESRANPATRTFRVEATVPNPDSTLKAGVSATLGLELSEVPASRVPARILALSDDGRTGVRYVDATGRVQFAAVDVIDETPEGVWVTGLPDRATVIIEGQDFVSDGAQVEPRRESEVAAERRRLAAKAQ